MFANGDNVVEWHFSDGKCRWTTEQTHVHACHATKCSQTCSTAKHASRLHGIASPSMSEPTLLAESGTKNSSGPPFADETSTSLDSVFFGVPIGISLAPGG